MFLSWFKTLFKKNKKRIKMPTKPLYKWEEFITDVVRHSNVTDMNGNSYDGPAASSRIKYLEYFKYYCTFLQKALLEGKQVHLPGIGYLQLYEKKPYTLKCGFKDGEIMEVKGKYRLKARAEGLLTKKYEDRQNG